MNLDAAPLAPVTPRKWGAEPISLNTGNTGAVAVLPQPPHLPQRK